ncbi:hypothetical protein FSARC_5608 [Fusarium sarcochroum]|uniref:Uncharacterized protein n=1 Tax=Fusarium sarcochroum TaxID=1208366 RepID=A0A8H4TZF3_9HYPO|nr:hypothetical protein FSARC_5608 [Fusarium sarcochroum]
MAQTFKQETTPQQTGPLSYSVSPSDDWTTGPALNGGCVAAVVHSVAVKHFTTALAKYDQPDVHTFHIEYLRYCTTETLEINLIELKRGSSNCTIQLQVSQNEQLKAIALATSTNFAQSLGPTCNTQWTLKPPSTSTPDFRKVAANEPDSQWVPGLTKGEVFPMGCRILTLYERGGMQVDGLVDGWNGFIGEPMDATHVAFMCDFMPSMADTLLRNGETYDGRNHLRKMEEWAERNPGVVLEMETFLSEAANAKFSENTISLDIEFKKRLPEDGLRWTFSRVETKKLQGGRMDMDITICDKEMDLICSARQIVLVLDAKKSIATFTLHRRYKMTITQVACVGVNPGINIINPGTPEGRILAGIWRNVTTMVGGPQRVFWGLEVLNPSRIWIFVDWESIEKSENFTKNSAQEALQGFTKICTHSEFIKHVNLSPSSDVLCATITEIMLVYFPKDFSQSQKDEASAKLQLIINNSFGECSDVEKFAHGWGVENDFPVKGVRGNLGCVFTILVGWSGYKKQRTFHMTEAYQKALEAMRTLKGSISFHNLSSNFSVIERANE